MKGNTYGAVTNEWFDSCICYTLISAADINGFIPAACYTVVRDEISDDRKRLGQLIENTFRIGVRIISVQYLGAT